jgi:SlyX protein
MSQDDGQETVARLETLESKVSFQDRTIDALNDVVTRQQDQIDQLILQVTQQRKTLESLDLGSVEGGEEPPPPHY